MTGNSFWKETPLAPSLEKFSIRMALREANRIDLYFWSNWNVN